MTQPRTIHDFYGFPKPFFESHPTPDHFIPLLYIAGLAGSANRPLERVVDGYAFGGLSMACFALDASEHLATTNNRPSAGLPDPRVMPPDDTNV